MLCKIGRPPIGKINLIPLLFLSHFLLETSTFRTTVVVSLTLTSALQALTMLLLWLDGVSNLVSNTGLSRTHGAQAGVKMATSALLPLEVETVFARLSLSVLLSTLLEHTLTLFLNICIREDAESALLWE